MDTMNTMDTIKIIIETSAVLIAIFSAVLAIRHYTAPRIEYERCQLCDYQIPCNVFKEIDNAPILLNIENTGREKAADIEIHIITFSPLNEFTFIREGIVIQETEYKSWLRQAKGHHFYVIIPYLNPSRKISIVLRCDGSLCENQIEELLISHSKGKAKERKFRHKKYDNKRSIFVSVNTGSHHNRNTNSSQ